MKNPRFLLIALILISLSAHISLAQDPVQPPKTKPVEEKPAEPDDQNPINIGETNEVVVPVIVTDGFGRFITGLKAQDFQVREDGKDQKIADFSDASSPFSVALLIDLSLSAKNKLDDIKKTAMEFVKLLQPRDRVLIVAFDEKVRFVGDFTGDQKELEKSIKSLKTSYLTSLYDAIDLTIREKMLAAKGRKAIVVLSDGVDTGSKKATYDSTLELIARSGVIAYSVRYETRNDGSKQIRPGDLPNLGGGGLGRSNFMPQARGVIQKQRPKDRDMLGIEYLQELANRSGAIYIRSESAGMTAMALYKIADEIRNQYTLVYNPSNEKKDGTFRRIAVNVKRDDLLIRWRQGYIAPKVTSPEKTK